MNPFLWWLGFIWSSINTLAGAFVVLVGGADYLGVRRVPYCWTFTVRKNWLLDRWMHAGGFFGLVKGNIAGVTCGAIIIMRAEYANEQRYTHEQRHVMQSFWLGPFHGPVYVVASIVAAIRGGAAYRDNALEVDARKAAGEQ